MPALINDIIPESIAEDLEISSGDEVISINDIKPRDLLDYRYLTSAEDVTLHISRTSGEEEIIEIEKDLDEDLGINFESPVFDKILSCNNRCIFCFVDQQPTGLRNSLYIKDDDYRLSYFQGTYITLTNLRAEDRKRIEDLRPGPLYISVHTTDPELRAYMLKNPRAKNILNDLKWLDSLEIPVHTQIVLCPEINDGIQLDKTLDDLAQLDSIASIAVVPVGITKYRSKGELSRFSKEKAQKVIFQIEKFNKKTGFNLAFPSDELYILADYNFPDYKYYNNFGQLDDGVGTSRLLQEDFERNKFKLPDKISNYKEITVVAGKIACKALNPIIAELNKINNLKIELLPIKSNFWGEDVTVSGLITGQDLLDNLLPIQSKLKHLVIPSVMFRKYTDEFLDSMSLQEIQNKLNVPINIIKNYYSTDELIDLILK